MSAHAQSTSDNKVDPYQIKAAFIFNFLQFVDFKRHEAAEPDDYRVCLWDKDLEIGNAFKALEDKKLKGNQVHIAFVKDLSSMEGCRVLYVTSTETEDITNALTQIHGHSILTVGDAPQFLELGGMISFALRDNKLRFSVNLPPAKEAGLFISSRLLRLAEEVKQ